MNQQPDISVITINYNGYNDTCELINSWSNIVLSLSSEFIVIDNGSKENEAELLKKKYPFIIAVRSDKNLGFAGGNNIGIIHAKSNYILFINNDTVIVKDTLSYLIKRLKSSDKIVGASPLIRDYHKPHKIQYAGYTPLSLITLRNKVIGEGQTDEKLFPSHATPYLHGAAMLLKKDVIKEIGLMPEEYFLYYEELDWCTSITKQGYELWYEPACEIWHKESKTIGIDSPMKCYYLNRNRLLYASRNRSGIIRYLAILYLSVIAAPKNAFIAYLKGEKEIAKTYFIGTKAFFKLKNKKL